MADNVAENIIVLVNNALTYAKAGYHVFPLLKFLQKGDNSLGTPIGWNHNKPDHKHSIPSTIDTLQIIDWEFKYGDNLIGYGVNPRNNHAVILDVDIKDGKHGLTSLQRLIDKYSLPKSEFIVKSKSGGIHLYYAYPDGLKDDIVGIPFPNFKHIDIRTSNTFVVGPGSFGGKYAFDIGVPSNKELLVHLSQEVVELLPKRLSLADQKISLGDEYEKDISLSGEIPEIIPLGERDNTIIRLIGSWVRAGISRKNVTTLTEAAIAKCEKKDGELFSIVEYLPKIESTFDKSTFSKPAPEPLQFFLDNAVYVRSLGGVYEIPSRRVYLKDLISLYANHIYYVESDTGKSKEVSAFAAWKKSKKRKEVHGIGYLPVPDTITYDMTQNAEIVNLYIPPVFPELGPNVVSPVEDICGVYDRFCEYLFADKAELMMDWAAHMVQKPDEKLSIAPVMVSESRGVGKNLFFDIVSTMVGKHNSAVFSTEQMVDPHNDYILRNHLVLVNESYISIADKWSRKSRNQMIEDTKMLITDSAQSVNPKFIAPFLTTSYVNYIFASNNLNAVPMEENDRRFEVVVIQAKPLDQDTYNKLWAITANDHSGKLLSTILRNHLLKRKITKVAKGITASKVDSHKLAVIQAGRSPIEEEIYDAIENKESVFQEDIVTFELFAWFILERVDPSTTRDFLKSLFKMITRPIRVGIGSSTSRQMNVDYPPLTIKNATIMGGKGRKSLATVRDFMSYENNTISTKELAHKYSVNFEATKTVHQVSTQSSALSLIK
jgi:hypothetical protein